MNKRKYINKRYRYKFDKAISKIDIDSTSTLQVELLGLLS